MIRGEELQLQEQGGQLMEVDDDWSERESDPSKNCNYKISADAGLPPLK